VNDDELLVGESELLRRLLLFIERGFVGMEEWEIDSVFAPRVLVLLLIAAKSPKELAGVEEFSLSFG
jgi:hypothetical protein